jgi:hypothetical protein
MGFAAMTATKGWLGFIPHRLTQEFKDMCYREQVRFYEADSGTYLEMHEGSICISEDSKRIYPFTVHPESEEYKLYA